MHNCILCGLPVPLVRLLPRLLSKLARTPLVVGSTLPSFNYLSASVASGCGPSSPPLHRSGEPDCGVGLVFDGDAISDAFGFDLAGSVAREASLCRCFCPV